MENFMLSVEFDPLENLLKAGNFAIHGSVY